MKKAIRILSVLAFAMSALFAYTSSAAERAVWLRYCYLPDESVDDGILAVERPVISFFQDDSDWQEGKYCPQGGTLTIYSLPPVGMKIDYWLQSTDRFDIALDRSSARCSYGASSITVNYGSGDLYIGARFAYIVYGLEFAGNGNTEGSMEDLSDILYPDSFSLPKNSFTKTGYTFAGWRDSKGNVFSDQATVSGIDFGVVDDKSVVTLTAQWVANTYTVTLDRQNGSGGTGSITATYASALPSITIPTRTGYTFEGYWTAPNGSGTQYYTADGKGVQNWNITKATTLYAKWSINKYTLQLKLGEHISRIYYKINGASNWVSATSDTVLSVNYGSTWYVYAEAPVGYTAQYSNATSSYSAVKANSTESFTLTATANKYNITLDRQNGSGGTGSITATYASALPSITIPTYPGRTFSGYWTGTGGTGKQYFSHTGQGMRNWDIASDEILYAHWVKNVHTLTIAQSTGTGSGVVMPAVGTYSFDYGDVVTLSAQPNDNSSFVKWSDGVTSASRQITISSDLTISAEFDLYSPVTIHFDSNGGEGLMSDVEIPCSTHSRLPSNEFTRMGYAFAGWTSSAFPDVTYADGGAVYFNIERSGQTVTFRAAWQPNEYTVEFESAGGDGEMQAQAFVYDEEKALSACTFNPPYPGEGFWEFAGWSNRVANIFYSPGEIVSNLTAKADDVVKLTAVWNDTRTELSKAMHCVNLNWINAEPVSSVFKDDWAPLYSDGAGYNSDSCVKNTYSIKLLAANVQTNGTLSFYCKCSGATEETAELTVAEGSSLTVDSKTQNILVSTESSGAGWQKVTIKIDRPLGVTEWWVKIQNFTSKNARIYIDQMTWTIEGAPVEPTEADARDITAVSLADGVLLLTFADADERFSYNLRGTNDLTAPLKLWPVLSTTNGTGTITVKPAVDPAEPKMFFYLETATRQN